MTDDMMKLAGIVKKRYEIANRSVQKDKKGFIGRARRFGVDDHPLGCVCERCNTFWNQEEKRNKY